MKHYEYIAINYDSLSDGDSDTGNRTERCYRSDELGDSPSRCDLTVENEGGVLKYHCFSASCPCSGRVDTKTRRLGNKVSNEYSITCRTTMPYSKQYKKADGTTKRLVQTIPRPCIEYLEENNVSTRDALHNGLRYDPIGRRLVYPVQIDGLPRGYIYRDIRSSNSDTRKRKWIRMKGFKGAIIPFEGKGDTCYFVEALTSALFIKQHEDVPVLAMLSIMFDEGKRNNARKWLNTQGIKNVVLLPDPDVSRKMCIKLKRELTLDGFNVSVKYNNKKPRFCNIKDLING